MKGTKMTTPPRDNLCREAAFTNRSDSNDGFTLEGYGAVFGQKTRIDSWEGTFDEQIQMGAFKKTLRERSPVMQFDHGSHPLIGSIPIGSIKELREEEAGLWVSGRMTDNWLMEPVRMAIAEGNIKGMSFRFNVVRERWEDVSGKELKDPYEISELLWNSGDRGPLTRTITEVKLLEVGPVVWPAYDQTSVGVRAREVASRIRSDRNLAHSVQSSLARDSNRMLAEVASDPEIGTQVARMVLWGPAAPQEQQPEVPSVEDTPKAEDAPLSDEHPSTVTNPEDANRYPLRNLAVAYRDLARTIGEKSGT